jgi:acylphosphatase
MAERIARRVVVHGRVQGVFFRDSTRREARAAGVTGWVRNAADGSVQAHLEGPPDGVERVVRFMRAGPPEADVGDVDVDEATVENASRFEVR